MYQNDPYPQMAACISSNLQLSACICNDAMFAILVNLCEDGSEATWLFVVTEAGINDEHIGSVSSGVINDWLRAKVGLQFLKSFQSIWRQLAAFPRTVFFC